MQLSLVFVLLTFGTTQAAVFRTAPVPHIPEEVVPEVPEEVPECDMPDPADCDLPAHDAPEEPPEVKCGPIPPWANHTPYEPNIHDFESMCHACKVRACNAHLAMPGDGAEACRCQYHMVHHKHHHDVTDHHHHTYVTDCRHPFADGVTTVGNWTQCPGHIRDCEELEGQCVSAHFHMDHAQETTHGENWFLEKQAPGIPELEEPEAPEAKCGPMKPWSEHTPLEPNVNDEESMCQACKIRACNAKLPMPGDGGKACRCQYSKVGDTVTTDCKPPFADGVESVGKWKNCPGGVRNCKELEGQCVSATFKMDSAPEVPKAPWQHSHAATQTTMSLAALALFYFA